MMTALSYVVEGGASHFLDECLVITKCIRCDSHVDKSPGAWATVAQVLGRRSGGPPVLCGGVLCAACHGAFVRWLDNPQLNGVDSG